MGLACQPECSLTWAIDLQLVRDMSLQDMTWRADWCYPLVDLWAAILNVHGENKRNNSCSGHLQYTWNVGLSDNASDVPSLSWQYYAGHLHAFYSTVAQGRPETRHLALITALLDRISTADKKKRLWILPRLKKHWYLRHQQGRQETRLIDSDMADEEIKFYS